MGRYRGRQEGAQPPAVACYESREGEEIEVEMPLIVPDAVREKRLREIQRCLSAHKDNADVGALAEAVALMLQVPAFQKQVAASARLLGGVSGEAELMKLAWAFVYSLLYADDFVAAAMVLWEAEVFSAKPHCVQLVWNALMTKRMICIIGGGALGKTYSTCAFFLLSWVADPEWCKIEVASASEKHLQKNAFADLVRLHSGASMTLPGKVDTEAITLDKKRGYGIFTLVIPGGPDSKATLKGSHLKARPAHPKFGRRSRVFCLVDESQECPENIYGQIKNRFSSLDEDDVDHQKFVLTSNPKQIFSEFGNCAKPARGWDSISRADETWESERGWTVVSLDAMKHENVIQRRIVYPGFVTWGGVQTRLKDCHGNWDDPQMFTYIFGKFPPQGLGSAIIKQNWLTAAQREWIFDERTEGKAGADPAFTGDRPSLAFGRTGRAVGWIDYAGERHLLAKPQMAIQIDVVTVVARGDSQELADNYMEPLKPLGVKPEGFGIDKTGQRGVYDIMRRQWASKVSLLTSGESIAPIHGIEYAGLPSEMKVADEDTATPREMYDIMASALWYEAAKLFECGVVAIGKGVDLKVFAELSAREGGMQPGLGKKLTVESKKDFKRRTGMASPDLADATLIMLHVARITTPGLIPKAKDTTEAQPERSLPAWSGFNQSFGTADLQGMAGAELCDLTKD